MVRRLLIVLALAATTASLDVYARADSEMTVPFSISGSSGLAYDIYRIGEPSDGPIARCYETCAHRLPAGRYRVVASGDNSPPGETTVLLRHPALAVRMVGETGSQSAKTAGLVLGTVGTVVSGIALATALVLSNPFGENRNALPRSDTPKNVALGVAGAAALGSFVGWVMNASNATHLSAREDTPRSSVTAFGLVPLASVGSPGGFFTLTLPL